MRENEEKSQHIGVPHGDIFFCHLCSYSRPIVYYLHQMIKIIPEAFRGCIVDSENIFTLDRSSVAEL